LKGDFSFSRESIPRLWTDRVTGLRRDRRFTLAGAQFGEAFESLRGLRIGSDAVERDQHRFNVTGDVELRVVNARLIANTAGYGLCLGQTNVMYNIAHCVDPSGTSKLFLPRSFLTTFLLPSSVGSMCLTVQSTKSFGKNLIFPAFPKMG
jgi:hypothetical protein